MAVLSAATLAPCTPAAALRRAACPAVRACSVGSPCSRARLSRCGRPTVAASRATVVAAASAEGASPGKVEDGSMSVVLLAGGVGKRMKASMPKQYLPLRGKPIATWSLETFAAMPEVGEIVVVCDPSYRDIFEDVTLPRSVPLKFALPGKERQDSVFNGLSEVAEGAALVAVHDSARPLVRAEDVSRCAADAARVGAAVLGVQSKQTIKEAGADLMVVKTLDRSRLWEMQTPQIIEPGLLKRAFEKVNAEGLEVTDDISVVEHLGAPAIITVGDYTNIKVTTPEDMFIAERFLDEVGVGA
ncbi:unnamed protein product [Pedinophyceae sp. YPF-701]|nr:unnamed protein product [Pedinophyceae sp. YPF-701]